MGHFIIVGILVAGSTYFLYTYVLTNANLLPAQASTQAAAIDKLFSLEWFFISFFLSLIIVFILYSVVVFRRREGDDSDGKYMEGNPILEVVWTLIPLGIVLYLAYVGSQGLGDVERRRLGELEINVVASQWNWRFEYPDGLVTNQLGLPEDRQVLLRMRSEDVIHSFWVPEFRVKQDILPGDESFVRELRITPTELGDYKVRCAELCGSQHYAMLADVIVMTENDYGLWLEEQAAGCDLDDVTCGERWVNVNGCTACHSLDGSDLVAPTWLGVYGAQEELADGSIITVDDEYIRMSILEPNTQIVDGYADGLMPQNFGELLDDEQIGQIIAFIASLQ